jgi:hypothetical protein
VPPDQYRAGAQLAIALWQVVHAASEHAPQSHLPAIDAVAKEPLLVPAGADDEGVAAYLAGERTTEALAAAVGFCRSLASTDPEGALKIVDGVLAAARLAGDSRILAAALRAAAEVGCKCEDWRVVGWAEEMVAVSGTTQESLMALNDAIIVAGAHRRFQLASWLVEDISDRNLPEARWEPGRVPRVEIAEWEYQLRLCGMGQDRRRLEMAFLTGERPSVGSALAEMADLRVACESLPGFDGQRSEEGDADAGYVSRLHYRTAEFHLADAHRLELEGLDASRDAAVQRALSLLDQAEQALGANATEAPVHRRQVIKARLWAACLKGQGALASALAGELLDSGWVLARSCLPIAAVLAETATTSESPALTRAVRSAALAALETETLAYRPVISDVHRRLQLSSLGGRSARPVRSSRPGDA